MGVAENVGTGSMIKMNEWLCDICGRRVVKHIIKDGSRFHVHRYALIKGQGKIYCSEKDCEDNHGNGVCNI